MCLSDALVAALTFTRLLDALVAALTFTQQIMSNMIVTVARLTRGTEKPLNVRTGVLSSCDLLLVFRTPEENAKLGLVTMVLSLIFMNGNQMVDCELLLVGNTPNVSV